MTQDLTDRIPTQLAALLQGLGEHGWKVVDRSPGIHWWQISVWAIESEWSPPGLQLLLNFVETQEPDLFRATGWNIHVVASLHPLDRGYPGHPKPYLWFGQGWRDRIREFIVEFDRHRNEPNSPSLPPSPEV